MQPWSGWSSDNIEHGAVSAAVDRYLLQTRFYWEKEKGNTVLEKQVCTHYVQHCHSSPYFVSLCFFCFCLSVVFISYSAVFSHCSQIICRCHALLHLLCSCDIHKSKIFHLELSSD